MIEQADTSAHSIDDILMPLAIAGVIDHKVRKVEQTAFAELSNGLLELFDYPVMSMLEWGRHSQRV